MSMSLMDVRIVKIVFWVLFGIQSTSLAQIDVNVDTVVIESTGLRLFNDKAKSNRKSKICASNSAIGQENYFSSYTFNFTDMVFLKRIEIPIESKVDSCSIKILLFISNHDSSGTLIRDQENVSVNLLHGQGQNLTIPVDNLQLSPGLVTISFSISGDWKPDSDKCMVFAKGKLVKNDLQFSLNPITLMLFRSPDVVNSKKISPDIRIFFSR